MANLIKDESAEPIKTDHSPELLEGQKTEGAGPPKNQLRRRVETRIAQLIAELERLNDDPAKHKQIRAIHLALKGVHDTMSESSENVGRMEAAQMSRWLDSVKYLGGGS
jgi:hypothetical protein